MALILIRAAGVLIVVRAQAPGVLPGLGRRVLPRHHLRDFTLALPRYVGAIFPVVMVLGIVAKRRWLEYTVYLASAVLLIVSTHIAFALQLIA